MNGSTDAILSFQGAILVAIIGVLGVILSVIMSYIIVKVQTKSASMNLDRQFSMELRKLELDYKLKREIESKKYVNQLLLEKATELQTLFILWARQSRDLAERYNDYLKLKEPTKKEYNQMIIDVKRIEQENPYLTREVSILINYFLKIKKQFDRVSLYYVEHLMCVLADKVKEYRVSNKDTDLIDSQIKEFLLMSIDVSDMIDTKIISILEDF